MEYLHYEFDAGDNDLIETRLDKAANVMLLDSLNYGAYRRGSTFNYVGGYVKVSPYVLRPPHSGHWHLVIDLGGHAGAVRASARLLPQRLPTGAMSG